MTMETTATREARMDANAAEYADPKHLSFPPGTRYVVQVRDVGLDNHQSQLAFNEWGTALRYAMRAEDACDVDLLIVPVHSEAVRVGGNKAAKLVAEEAWDRYYAASAKRAASDVNRPRICGACATTVDVSPLHPLCKQCRKLCGIAA
jgi:hypothetical protein